MEITTVPVCCYAHDEPMQQSAPSSPSALHLCWGQTCSPPILPTCSDIVRGLKSCSFRTSQTWSCLTDVCFCCFFSFRWKVCFWGSVSTTSWIDSRLAAIEREPQLLQSGGSSKSLSVRPLRSKKLQAPSMHYFAQSPGIRGRYLDGWLYSDAEFE